MFNKRLFAACVLFAAGPAALAQDYYTTPIETGPLAVGIRDFAVLPDSANGSSSGPARMAHMTADPLGRLFVNDQRGAVYHLSPYGDVTEYIDIKDFSGVQLSNASGERGFQSFAFHPDFNNAGTPGFGKLYTVHSSSNRSPTPDFDPGGNSILHTVVMEWSVTDPTAATYATAGGSAPREVMRLDQPFGNHNAGQLAFNTSVGPGHTDYGNLYLAFGDGGSGEDPQENGQDPGNPYGAILRIDPTDPDGGGPLKYTPAANNDLTDTVPGALPEVYAYGLRNPQRFGWDDTTGDLFIADIGQYDVEEIDHMPAGLDHANFGWDQREGSFFFEGAKTTGMTDPILEYDHTDTADDIPTGITQRAVTVAEVVRGGGVQALEGQLLLGDFPTGMIFHADADPVVPAEGSGQDPLAQLVMVARDGTEVQLLDLINAARSARGLGNSSRADLRFSMGTAGEVYVLNKHDGVVRVLTPVLDGDVDGDGDVDDADLGTILAKFTGPIGAAGGRALADGDTDFDGDIDDADLGTSFANFTGPGGPANVPEPGGLGVFVLGAAAMRRGRRP